MKAMLPASLVGQSPESPSGNETQNGSPKPKLPKPKLDIKALFDYYSRKQHLNTKWRPSTKKKKVARRKSAKCKERETCERRPRKERVPGKKGKKELTEKVVSFPFVERLYGVKRIPIRVVSLYEQAALNGFFRCVEMLKIEKSLKKSLTQLNAVDDLENESLESRKHKYVDEDELLSPIEETNGDDQTESSADKEEMGAKIVETSCFILSSKIPKKTRKRKSNTTSN
ncbi:TATA box-binding protein-associated factor RNA polymerase I subunit D [Zootoca vivipara]|uniref:TATA box-binding protein-associated factor RNA polymerase I subunit D n=1 Tax=Zootoca vivipara TaxID=8524 RepID=UPI001591E195|nr:TATA box-binding protein-associated factor RNA polymerase I subunit D [Zootoca vivipara]XP_034971823.1 TATA box-binding protein-associated factor RNA polymerase I subunit D [Zootoca vivipara]XP_034971824.1 TATA box-binding protein-associated factor RNA polymerase I subunit D [Zootoca vivipara]XP_060129863.1 TATA box-binding protein-associated factor RNA polymerase I subunit D [Zootoca vivipara]